MLIEKIVVYDWKMDELQWDTIQENQNSSRDNEEDDDEEEFEYKSRGTWSEKIRKRAWSLNLNTSIHGKDVERRDEEKAPHPYELHYISTSHNKR